jgi:hypothetical protein
MRLRGGGSHVRQSRDLPLEFQQFTMQGIILLRGEVGHFGQSLAKCVLAPEKIKSQRRRAQH